MRPHPLVPVQSPQAPAPRPGVPLPATVSMLVCEGGATAQIGRQFLLTGERMLMQSPTFRFSRARRPSHDVMP
jgi:hypothetical protein